MRSSRPRTDDWRASTIPIWLPHPRPRPGWRRSTRRGTSSASRPRARHTTGREPPLAVEAAPPIPQAPRTPKRERRTGLRLAVHHRTLRDRRGPRESARQKPSPGTGLRGAQRRGAVSTTRCEWPRVSGLPDRRRGAHRGASSISGATAAGRLVRWRVRTSSSSNGSIGRRSAERIARRSTGSCERRVDGSLRRRIRPGGAGCSAEGDIDLPLSGAVRSGSGGTGRGWRSPAKRRPRPARTAKTPGT